MFHYGGGEIGTGYHVTEVKAARLSSLDCGGNPEEWSETVIQLWDVEGGAGPHMAARKFLGILGKVAERMALDDQSLLIFEAGDSTSPLQVFTVGTIAAAEGRVNVSLTARPATCKPRDRGLEAAAGAAASMSCCTPAASASPCCG